MNRLIKLSETHYIIVDNSEIKEGDYHVATRIIKSNGVNAIAYTDKEQLEAIAEIGGAKKITHSTQPLEIITALPDTGQGEVTEFGYNKIKPLSLSEVEELINGYSVEKMAEQQTIEDEFNSERSYINGFNAHKELVKDRLFTVEDMFNAHYIGYIDRGESDTIQYPKARDYFKKSILPKTEWNINFDENGKLKLA